MGALNFLFKKELKENDITDRWDRTQAPNFHVAKRIVEGMKIRDGLVITLYSDEDNRSPSPALVIGALADGSVVIPSCRVIGAPQGVPSHMLTFYDFDEEGCQVWDTNNRFGYIRKADIARLFDKSGIRFPNLGGGFLENHLGRDVAIISHK